MSHQQLFIFGLGYSSSGIARQAQAHGWSVTSTVRQPERFARLQSARHSIASLGNANAAGQLVLDEDGLAALQASSYVLSSIPPLAAPLYDPVLAAQRKLLRQALDAGCSFNLGYLSSTGVYGDWGGEYVDESSEPRTTTARGLVRLAAEQAWLQLAEDLQVPLTIFRLGGIYGPKRSVLNKGPSSSNTARRSRQRYTSRCHVADVAQAVLVDMQRRHLQRQQIPTTAVTNNLDKASAGTGPLQCPFVDVINVVDDEPAPRQEVELFAQQLLQARKIVAPSASLPADQPAQADELQSRSAKRSTQQVVVQQGIYLDAGPQANQQQSRKEKQETLEEKRVCNAKLKRMLSAHHGGARQLIAPTYREGLQLIMDSQTPFEQVDLDCIFGNNL